MSLIGRPRARLKPPAERVPHQGLEALALKPEQAIPYIETLRAICNLTGEIERSIEGDDGKRDILLRIIDLSKWILAEAESLPSGVTLRTLVISVEAYKWLLQLILTQLVQKGRTMDSEVEKGLNAQLDLYLEIFREGFSRARSTGGQIQPVGRGSTGFFRNARNFIIEGGNFISYKPDANLQGISEEIL